MPDFWSGLQGGMEKGAGFGAQLARDLRAQQAAEAARAYGEDREENKFKRDLMLKDMDAAESERRWNEEMELKRRDQALREKSLGMKGGNMAAGAVGGMTPGRKSADMAFGKDYTDWASGGFAQAQKGLEALKSAREMIAPTDPRTGVPVVRQDLSGGIRGKVPDVIRTITNPEAVTVKETIRGAVMNTLRATLGSAFTDREGERIFNMAYNDQLPPEENLRRLDRITKELEGASQAKQSMSDYFEQTGSLTGWQGRMPVLGQDEAPMDAKAKRLMELRAKKGM